MEQQVRKPTTSFLLRFIKGFIHRDRPLCPDNEEFIVFMRKNYILNLRYHVPKNVLDKSWLKPPGILENVRTPLRLRLQVPRAGVGGGGWGEALAFLCAPAPVWGGLPSQSTAWQGCGVRDFTPQNPQ